jgi:2-amino-4-hydroxy-6-hydroxymethyldihydropteridine diphosphokinase
VSRAFVCLGSNHDPERNLPRAVDLLGRLGRVTAASRVYESPDSSGAGPNYLNASVALETDRAVSEVHTALGEVEAELGRDRAAPGRVPIDLDLCLFDALVCSGGEVDLPHPDVTSKPHVAVTLAECDPAFLHPLTEETLSQVAARLGGESLRPRPEIRLRAAGGAERGGR